VVAETPEVSVVVATFERAWRLERVLAAMRAQTLAPDRFEVIVVDDASGDGTAELLEREREAGGIDLRPIARGRNGGWAAAREDGRLAARAELVAFTDDDCIPDPGWLEAGLGACAENPGAIVQGRTIRDEAEWSRLSGTGRAFARTLEITRPDPHFQTCNVFYPRELIERAGGFDIESFSRVPGEDADLAWRAIEAGAPTAFAPEALVRHAVEPLGAIGKLRAAARVDLRVYARHPRLREAYFVRRVFWKGSHYLLVRALVGIPLPRRLLPVRAWLAVPYSVHLVERGRVEGGGPPLAPYYLLHDLIEVAAAARSALRHRVPML
jgi:GT2 family glycosyltransferase